jgi:hypothetical protein
MGAAEGPGTAAVDTGQEDTVPQTLYTTVAAMAEAGITATVEQAVEVVAEHLRPVMRVTAPQGLIILPGASVALPLLAGVSAVLEETVA